MKIKTDSLKLLDGEQLSANTQGDKNGDELFMQANEIEINEALFVAFNFSYQMRCRCRR